jgi:protein-S-isoprenylcysteine O-methyltransferase Ste14
MAKTTRINLVEPEERRWFVPAAVVVLVLVGLTLLLQPFETIPGLGDTCLVGRIIGAVGLGIIIRIAVLANLALRTMRRRERGDLYASLRSMEVPDRRSFIEIRFGLTDRDSRRPVAVHSG